MVRLDQAQTGEISDRPPLIVEGDRFGIVHSEQDLGGGINAHVMDKGADCVIACLNAQRPLLRGPPRPRPSLSQVCQRPRPLSHSMC